MKPVNFSGKKNGENEKTNDRKTGNQGKKRAAYKSFSGLKNIFVDNSLCENFSLWSPKSQSRLKSPSDDKITSDDKTTPNVKTTSSDKTAPNDKTTSDDKKILEYNTAAQKDTQETKTMTEMGEKATIARKDDQEEIVFEIDVDVNSADSEFTEGVANFIGDALSTPIPIVDPNDDGFVLTEELINAYYDSYLADDGTADPSDFSSSISSSPKVAQTRPAKKTFVTPYNSKKNCGCDRCLMPKCGSCYNCLNKRKTR